MPKQQFKRRHESGSEDELEVDSNLGSLLEDIKEAQKMRKRPAGLSVAELNHGVETPETSYQKNTDPLNLKTGGLMNLRKLKRADLNDADIEEGIKQTFSKESHLRDEDEEMRKYVEDEVLKRKGQNPDAEQQSVKNMKKNDDDALYELPENLRKYQSKRNEDMLSNQMLCGIPEVDLGIEAKIRNIEETEAAKLKLLKEALDKKMLTEKLTSRQNLTKDLAKNYVQHNIYNIQETTKIGSEMRTPIARPRTEAVPVVDDDTPKWVQDGRTVERPEHKTQQIQRPHSMKPSDKQTAERFKNKFVRHQQKKK